MPKYTEKQLEAIEARNANLLVTAAAGSGKTAVLVERIIKMIIEDNVDVDRLLVMTYTDAAAKEMKERVYKAIASKLREMPENKHLQRQLMLMPKAYIMTIHSFCLSVIRKYFYVIDLDPDFRVSDGTEVQIMFADAFDEALDSMFEGEQAQEFARFYDGYGKSQESTLNKFVNKLYAFAMSTPYPKLWIKSMMEKYEKAATGDFEKSEWAELIRAEIKNVLPSALRDLYEARQILREFAIENETQEYVLIETDGVAAAVEALDGPLLELGKKLLAVEYATRLSVPTKMSEEDKERVKELRNGAKSAVGKLVSSYANTLTEEGIEIVRKTVCDMKMLCEFTLLVEEIYSLKKRNKHVLDFDDLQHMCINILTEFDEAGNVVPSKVAREVAGEFHEILVDEYQDSNVVQETVFNAIAKENNLFVVGDMKQSIYRFRHANPQLFKHKKQMYSENKGATDRKVTLAKNFRSDANVLKAVNYIFSNLMSEAIGEMVYDSEEYLYNGLELKEVDRLGNPKEEDHDVEVHIIDKSIAEEGEDESVKYTTNEYEAVIVGKRIKELIDSKYTVYDKNEDIYRPLRYNDIAILLRNPTTVADSYVGILNDMKIPVYCETAGSYFEAVEIRTMISVLETIDNPYQDIPLIATMRSPMFSFNAEDLAKIRTNARTEYFYDALKTYADKEGAEDSTQKKAKRFLAILRRWQDHAKYTGTHKLIEEIYSQTGYYSSVGAMYDGSLRQANLRLLSSRASDYEKTSFKGLFSFINYIKKLRLNGKKMENARNVSENSDVVRIVSMHKSKGLEFPVVFVSGLGTKFHMKDLSEPVLFHIDYGFATDYINAGENFKVNLLTKNIIKKKLRDELLSEELRLLYVAMTRARDKLILTGVVPDKTEGSIDSWVRVSKSGGVSDKYMENCTSFMGMLGPSFVTLGLLKDWTGEPSSAVFADEFCDAKWRAFLHYTQTVPQAEQVVPNPIDLSAMSVDEQITERFGYVYPFKKSTALATKMTVSELKRIGDIVSDDEQISQLMYESELKPIPDFVNETKEELTGARRGTFIHYIMESIEICDIMDEKMVKENLDALVREGLIDEGLLSDEDCEKICRFFMSKTGQEMVKYRESINREVPFVMNIDASSVYPDLDGEDYCDEKVLVQGVIDAYYKTPDGIVIVDYKTDRIREDIGELKEKYEKQLEYYAQAVGAMTGCRVCKKTLYSFALDGDISW